MEGTFNVITKGADPTGSSDSRAAIQSTIDDARESGGGIVFFPPGDYLLSIDESTGRALEMYGNISLMGYHPGITRLKMMGGQGGYWQIVGHSIANYVNDVRVTGLNFDSNTRNNPLTDPSDLGAHPRRSIEFWAGKRIHVSDCMFSDADCSTVVTLNGFISDARIVGNTFDISPSIEDHDHSSIYVDARTHPTDVTGYPGNGVWIRDNVIRTSVPGTPGARSGIETHGSGVFVEDNFISNMEIGMNITGYSDRSEGIVVANNQIHSAQRGMILWSGQHISYPDSLPPGIQDCRITGNLITLEMDAWSRPYARGIATNVGNEWPIYDLMIDHNIIRFLPYESVPDTQITYGIAKNDAPSPLHENWQIIDNLIVNSPGRPIRVGDIPGLVLANNRVG